MKKIGLAGQILIGLVLGILFGHFFHDWGLGVKPLGDAFIRLIKMIVVPIVLSSIILGIAGVGDIKKVGGLGLKTILYFEAVTTVAIVLGLGAANLFKPGIGVTVSQITKTDISSYAHATQHGNILLNIIPTNIAESLAKGDLLQIIFFSVLFGVALAGTGKVGKPVLDFFHGLADTMFRLTNMIMAVAPIGVFALISATVAQFGISVMLPLGKLIGVLYLTMAVFIMAVLGLISHFCKINFLKLLSAIKEEMLLAFSTASSETVLPKIMEKLKKMGCPEYVVSFVVPTGYTFNLDGSSLYQGLAIPFIAQVYGIHLSIPQQVAIILTLMLTSKGMAGVPGTSFIVLAATLASTGLPIEGLALIAGIDRIMDMGRTVVNVVGNSLAALVVSRFEGVKPEDLRPEGAFELPIFPEEREKEKELLNV